MDELIVQGEISDRIYHYTEYTEVMLSIEILAELYQVKYKTY